MLYEPTLFALLDEEAPPPNEAEGIRQAVADAAAHLARGDRSAAAERFIDYWMGEGSWQRTPEARRAPIEEAIVHVQGWGTALFTQPTPLSDFGALDVPVLLMVGSDSPASSRGVARLLASVLPRVQRLEFDGLGHMGPITHPRGGQCGDRGLSDARAARMTHPLDNPVWHALCGPHRGFALRHGLALHYPREVAAFSAIAESSDQAYADLARGLPPDTDEPPARGPVHRRAGAMRPRRPLQGLHHLIELQTAAGHPAG